MATTGNPILFALRDLGTGVRTIFQDEASRRQAELTAQGQENEQRRALESLRLSGQQQLARLGIEEARTRFEVGSAREKLDLERERLGVERQRAQTEAEFRQAQTGIAQAQAQREQKVFEDEERPVVLGEFVGGMGTRLIQQVGQEEAMPLLSYGNAALLAMGYNPEQTVKRREAREIVKQITSDPALFLSLSKLGARAQIEQFPVGDPRRQALQQQYDEAFIKPKDLDTAFQHFSTAKSQGAIPEQVTWRDHLYTLGLATPPPGYETFDQAKAGVLATMPEAKRQQLADPALPPAKRLELHKEIDTLTMQVRRTYGEIGTVAKMRAATAPPRATPQPPPAGQVSQSSAPARFAKVPEDLRNTIVAAASVESRRQNVLESDLLALMAVESDFDPEATNEKSGAAGLMQLIPTTAARYKVAEPYNVRQNIRGGAADWARALRDADGDPREAYRKYYNPGASDATTNKFLAARQAFAEQEQSVAEQEPGLVTGPVSGVAAVGRGVAGLGRRVGRPATGPLGALSNIFGSSPP